MIAIPITAFIIMIGLIWLQYCHYKHLELLKNMTLRMSAQGEFEKMKKEFDDYKKRVDSLTIKAGFKL